MKYAIRTIALLAALILLVVTPNAFAQAKLGEEAPDFEVTTLEGTKLRLSELRGKVVYLNIWATWCPPCVAEIPSIQKLAETHSEELVVIGVSCDTDPKTVRQFVEAYGIDYPVAMDERMVIGGQLYPTAYIPESVFISPEGTVTTIEIGGITYARMEYCFSKALGQ
ncbi:MAG: TlpA family protein disulfide reductase [Clostridia bacterium]|nr:TlpA family protein disulfide reductase [Clostridia bacterium]